MNTQEKINAAIVHIKQGRPISRLFCRLIENPDGDQVISGIIKAVEKTAYKTQLPKYFAPSVFLVNK